MTRFFANPSQISGGTVQLSAEDMSHIRVLRLKPDETFCVCDGGGTDYICRLAGNTDAAEILETRPSRGEPDVFCSVYLALSKGDKLESAVQKSVELGAGEIVLFPSARCVSVPDSRSLAKKIERLSRIALEAAKQSGRGRVPAVTAADSFVQAVTAAAGSGLSLFCYELEDSLSIKQTLESSDSIRTIAVIIGPEGGFAAEEASYAVSHGMRSVSLGPRILRCETAPLLALSAIMFHTGNI